MSGQLRQGTWKPPVSYCQLCEASPADMSKTHTFTNPQMVHVRISKGIMVKMRNVNIDLVDR